MGAVLFGFGAWVDVFLGVDCLLDEKIFIFGFGFAWFLFC